MDERKKNTFLKALSIHISDFDIHDDPCRRCPLNPCETEKDLLAGLRQILRTVPEDPRSTQLGSILDNCLAQDEEICVSCPYAPKCIDRDSEVIYDGGLDIDNRPLFKDLYAYFRSIGLYGGDLRC